MGTDEITNWDWRFIGLAKEVSSWSKDPRTKVGAVIAAPNHSVISLGFNGFPAGMPDDKELYEDRTEKLSRIVHAEVNAIIYATKPIPEGSSLYVFPFIPCDRCVVQMLQAGIKRFVSPECREPAILEKWGEAFERTKKYIKECKGVLIEL